jgi:excisionase family DNA binding protein
MAKTSKSKGYGDRLMTLPELAKYLHLKNHTALKLATSGEIPGMLIERQWRFKPEHVDAWLDTQLIGDSADFEEIPDGAKVPLDDVMPEEALIGDLQAKDSLSVIEELAARAYQNHWLNDKPWFVGAVVERETLASTAMEGGVAFLHTRATDQSKIAQPFIIVGRSYRGIDFGAPDGEPTYLFFLLGLKYDKLHLPILGRLARVLRDPAVIARIRSLPSRQKIRAVLIREDTKSLASSGIKPAKFEKLKPTLDKSTRLRAIMRVNAQRKHDEKKAAVAEEKAQRAADKKAATAAAAAERKAARKAAREIEKAAKAKVKAAEKAEKAAAKKAAAKEAAAKKTAAKKPAAKKSAAKKSAAKKPAAKKTAAKKTAAKKTAAKKTAAKKPAAKKTAAKKTAAKKTAAKKTAAKKTAAKKTTAKKSTAKKPAAKKTAKKKATKKR